jgi:hypothetical protein
LLRQSPEPIGPLQTAHPRDELALVIEVPPADALRVLAVEVLRGPDRRDGWERAVPPSANAVLLAFRLRWRDRPDASSRLTCHVRLDGQLIGTPSVLLVGTAVDAQGRFAAAPIAPMSNHTQVAVLGAFDQLLAAPRENGAPNSVPWGGCS